MNNNISWSDAIKTRSFQYHLAGSLLGGLILITVLPFFFNSYLLPKKGIEWTDPVLSIIQPKENSTLIFFLIYGSILITLLSNLKNPTVIIRAVEAYLLINLLRVITLSLFTFEPPADIIPLQDPFVAKVAYGQAVFNKDLFFSGHTSTLFLLFLIEKKNVLKYGLLLSTCLVALLILWQHVHYSIDILAALPASYLCFWLAQKVRID